MQDNLNSMAPVSALAVEDRSEFIWKCYAHVVGAIFALIAVEYYLFTSGVAAPIANAMMGSPIAVMIGFVALSWGAGHLAHRLESTAAQYAAFAAFVVLWAVMFVPILAMAMIYGQQRGVNIIEDAAIVTVFGSAALIARRNCHETSLVTPAHQRHRLVDGRPFCRWRPSIAPAIGSCRCR